MSSVPTYNPLPGPLFSEDSWLKTLLESTGHVVFKYEFLPEKRFTYVSGSAQEVFGFSAEDHLSMPNLPIDAIHPDDRERLRDALAQASTHPLEPLLLRFFRKDGTLRYTRLYLFPHLVEGTLESCYGVHSDVSDQVFARRLLELKAKRLELIAAHAHEAMWVMDQAWRFTHVGERFATLLGESGSRLIGADLRHFLAPASADALEAAFSAVRLAGSFRDARPCLALHFEPKPGKSFTLNAHLRFLLDAQDLPSEALAYTEKGGVENGETSISNTDNKILQAQKLESLGVLAGGIAHDFNNLLVGILGNASLAAAELPTYSPARRSLVAIENSAKRAAELANQMLAYAGKGRFVLQPLNLSLVIEDMQHLLSVSLSKSVVLKYYLSASLPPVQADVSQLQQVLMNLVTNAGEAIEEKSGVVTIVTGIMECDRAYLTETYLDDDLPAGFYVYLEVSDTGVGMTPETKVRVFDPFFSTKFMGRGLGLAAVLGIVRGHRGAVKVYSEAGRGSTFKVLLPVYESAREATGSSSSPAPTVLHEKGLVLVVDDEETVRVVAKRMLLSLGFEVLLAADGLAAIELFRAQADRIRAVILDIAMPHLSGEDTFRELRRIRKDACIILSSGYNAQEVTARFGGKNFSAFIQKPYNIDDLIRTLSEALDN